MSDYIGFSFGHFHSRDLGLYRVSDGSRYQREVSAPMKDVTLQVESGRTHFLEARLEPKTISVSVAYDELTEEQITAISHAFNGKEVRPLIFDELPFKAYFARVQRSVNLNYVPFGTRYGERIYKGEGTIEFMLYDPLAVGTGKYLSDFPTHVFPNRDEWARASRMKMRQDEYDGQGTSITVYNAGDEETEIELYYKLSDVLNKDVEVQLQGMGDWKEILFHIPKKETNADVYVRLNSENHLFEGCNEYKQPTNTLYNKYIIAGDIFKLGVGEHIIESTEHCDEVRYLHRYY